MTGCRITCVLYTQSVLGEPLLGNAPSNDFPWDKIAWNSLLLENATPEMSRLPSCLSNFALCEVVVAYN